MRQSFGTQWFDFQNITFAGEFEHCAQMQRQELYLDLIKDTATGCNTLESCYKMKRNNFTETKFRLLRNN